jgi:hypothetical protein
MSYDEYVDPVPQRREDSKEGQLCLPVPSETSLDGVWGHEDSYSTIA